MTLKNVLYNKLYLSLFGLDMIQIFTRSFGYTSPAVW